MGIDVDSALVVGLSFTDLPDDVQVKLSDSEDVYELLEAVGLSRVSPWFDADTTECIIGVSVCTSSAFGDVSFDKELGSCQNTFMEFAGIEGKLICSPDVW